MQNQFWRLWQVIVIFAFINICWKHWLPIILEFMWSLWKEIILGAIDIHVVENELQFATAQLTGSFTLQGHATWLKV